MSRYGSSSSNYGPTVASDVKPPVSLETDIDAAVEAGVHAADATTRLLELGAEKVPVAIVPNTMSAFILEEALALSDARAPAPRRKLGVSTHEELESFIAHANRHKDPDSVVFANVAKTQLVALYDYNRAGVDGAPRWGQHRAIYVCPLSKQWQTWKALDGKRQAQVAFGDFVEANMRDLASPSQASGAIPNDMPAPADVLQMARDLRVLTNATYTRKIDRTTGEGELISKTENKTDATKIPRAFLLQLPVFEGGELYAVEARLRFEMADGAPFFTFVLFEVERIVRDAFGSLRKQVAEGTGLPFFAGTPE